MNYADRDPWKAEAESIEFDERDLDVAYAAELPSELTHHEIAADADEDFDDEFDEWLQTLSGSEDQVALLALEQSCDEDGMLLPWDMRGVRLWSAPPEAVSALHLFWDTCPLHVAAHVTHHVYWLIRAERAKRRGKPEWSPRHSLPPAQEERAFFRPSALVLRRWS